MKFKNTLLASFLLSAGLVSTANAYLICESFNTEFICENTTGPIEPGNSYSWSASGTLYMMNTGSYVGRMGCNAAGSGVVTATVTFNDGTSKTTSATLYCAGTIGTYSGTNQCSRTVSHDLPCLD